MSDDATNTTGQAPSVDVAISGECQKKAAELGFDLTKQFIALAFAGIAFVVGLSFNSPGAITAFMFWLTVGLFGVSAVVGLLFLMCGVGQLSVKNSYDIYAKSLRLLSGLQILLVLVGVICMIPILDSRPARGAPTGGSMEVKIDGKQAVVYPVDPKKNITVEVDGPRVKITTSQ